MLKIRCSEIHHIMGMPKKASETLSQNARNHLIRTFKQNHFGFTRFNGNACTEKGNLLEDAAIKASGMMRGKVYRKNQHRLENHHITGECDIWDERLVIDTKCSWDIGTHPFFKAEAVEKAQKNGYIWQVHGYMWLFDCDFAEIDFWLFPTPEQLLKPWERENPNVLAEYTQLVEQIPITKRCTTLRVERSDEAIACIIERVEAAQDFYQYLLSQI